MNRRVVLALTLAVSACSQFRGTPDVTLTKIELRHRLMPSARTVAWGYYDAGATPVLRIRSGDVVEVGTLLTSSPPRLEAAGVKPEAVEQSLRDVYEQVPQSARGPGTHILTGPIWIEGADSGDVLEVRILAIALAIPNAYKDRKSTRLNSSH